MREAAWTSPKPFGKGTTRTVKMAGGIRIDEVFWAWEPNRRIGFCFAAASIGWLNALAEVYEIAPLSRERCKLRWTLAVSLPGSLSNIEPLSAAACRPFRSACSGRLSALLVNTLPTMEQHGQQDPPMPRT